MVNLLLMLSTFLFALATLSIAQDDDFRPDCSDSCIDAALQHYGCGTADNLDYACACGHAYDMLDEGLRCLFGVCTPQEVNKTLDVAGAECAKEGYPIHLPTPGDDDDEPHEEPPAKQGLPVKPPIPQRIGSRDMTSFSAVDYQIPDCAVDCLEQSLIWAKCSTQDTIDEGIFDSNCSCKNEEAILQNADSCIKQSCAPQDAIKAFEEARKFCKEFRHGHPATPLVAENKVSDREEDCQAKRGNAVMHECGEQSAWPTPSSLPPAPTTTILPFMSIVALSSGADSCIVETTTKTLTFSITSTLAPFPTSSDLVPLPTATGTIAPSNTTSSQPIFTGRAVKRVVPVMAGGLMGLIIGLL